MPVYFILSRPRHKFKQSENQTIVPTEIIFKILCCLQAKDLIKCRLVCQHWNQIVQNLCQRDSIWRKYGMEDFQDVFKVAELKCKAGLSCYGLYKSLSLWPRLASAKITPDEFAIATDNSEEIYGFNILGNGLMGVHKLQGIEYYDLETLEKTNRSKIPGDYVLYKENAQAIVFLDFNLILHITIRDLNNNGEPIYVNFPNVKDFILTERNVYYIHSLYSIVYGCNLTNEHLTNKLFYANTNEQIMCMSFNGHLNIITSKKNLYSYDNNGNCILFQPIAASPMQILRKYDFLNSFKWSTYGYWVNRFQNIAPCRFLLDIRVGYIHGNILLLGTGYGLVRLYLITDNIDFAKDPPLKEWNFMEPPNCPVVVPAIQQLDIVEAENGHMILIATSKKIIVINFVHNFQRHDLVPYHEAQKFKVMKKILLPNCSLPPLCQSCPHRIDRIAVVLYKYYTIFNFVVHLK